MALYTLAADMLHEMKYRDRGESYRDACNRQASALKDSDEHFKAYRDILLENRFSPGGRIQSAIGSAKLVTAINCFVSGTIEDSFIAGPGNIMQRATEAAATMRMGGGIGYDFSTLRPRGDLIRKLQSHSSGPVSFMEIFNAICKTVASSGHRRGAQMGVLRVDHPDIVQFINAKHNQYSLTGFNISVGITNEFMDAVYNNDSFNLKFNGTVYSTVDANELFEMIMRSTWDWAEPGVLFLDTMNEWNNLYYCETISATNPCAEQVLPPFGSCLLGSFVLPKYLRRRPIPVSEVSSGTYSGYVFDWDLFLSDIPHVVRALDNVTDRTVYPLEEQKIEQKSKRRMGIGITGLANCAEALGYSYGSVPFISFEHEILSTLNKECYRASAYLSKEKGSFPCYEHSKYLNGKFIKTLDPDIIHLISNYGIRNSHLTSIAPTGTISMTSDNVSSGIEPVFSYGGPRTIQTIDGPIDINLEDYGYKFLGVKGKLPRDVTTKEHLNVLLTAQKHMDSACSKTINCPNTTPWEDFKNIYMQAWQGGAKGCATFTLDGKRAGLLKEGIETSVCEINPENGVRECS